MKHFYILFVLFLLPSLAIAQYAEYDWEERDTWMDPTEIFEKSNITKNSYVADIGCHEGYLSIHLAKKVGKGGRVFAVDVRQDRLDELKNNYEDRALYNIEPILGDYDNPKLPEGKLDVVVIMDTYHEMNDYMTILKHVKAALKPGGRIVIIEKLKSRIRGKSRSAQMDAHSLGPKYVNRELKKAGFRHVYQNNDMGDWENDSDKVIWMTVAVKPK